MAVVKEYTSQKKRNFSLVILSNLPTSLKGVTLFEIDLEKYIVKEIRPTNLGRICL